MRVLFATILFAAFLGLEITGQCQSNDWSNRIICKTRRPIASLINPHVSDVNILIVDGKKFKHVRGLKTFYLTVPHTNAVVFVADAKDYSVVYHFYNLDTREDIAIHALGSAFGYRIGPSNSQDKVESVDGAKIVLCSVYNGAKSTLPELANLDSVKSLYYLDLSKKAVAAEKTIYLDKAGNVIMQREGSPPF